MNQSKRLKILIILTENHDFGGTPLKFKHYKNASLNKVSIVYLNDGFFNLLKFVIFNNFDFVHSVFKKSLLFSILLKLIFPFKKFTYHFVNTDSLDFIEFILVKIAVILKFNFICPTNSIAKSKKIKTFDLIYNGANIDKTEIENRDPNMILSVGGLNIYKNHFNLIKAMVFLDKKIKLYIIGDGPLNGDLKILINKLNLNARVFLVGYANPFKYYKKCSLYVHPSLSEGFGISTVEAVLSNTNICLSDIRTHKELYGEYNVNFFKIDDPKDIANQIQSSMGNKLDSKLLEFAYNNLTLESFTLKLDNYAQKKIKIN